MSVQAANLFSKDMTDKPRTFTGTEARHLMRARPKAALASLNRANGTPYASLANVATTAEGSPIILISTLAWHTRNLLQDARGSLMFDDTDGLADALTGRTDQAIQTLERQRQEEPNFTESVLVLAMIHLDEGRPDNALPLVQEVQSKHPRDPTPILLCGRILRELGRLEEAAAELEKVETPPMSTSSKALENAKKELEEGQQLLLTWQKNKVL